MGLLGDLIGPVVNAGMGIYSGERNRSQANAARDHTKYMWDLNNAYNTPTAQRQRLVDAGLNPALMYQTMPQNTSSVATSSAMGNTDVRFDPNSFLMMANLENIQANTAATRADTERKQFDLERERINAPVKTDGLVLDNSGKEVNLQINQIERKYREESLQLKNAGFDLSNQQTKKYLSQMDARFKNEMGKMTAEIRNIASQTAVNKGTLAVQKSTVDANQIRTVLDKYEAVARRAGWSYSDNILFRQIVDSVSKAANMAHDRTGKGSQSNTNLIEAAATLLSQLFGD